MIVTGRRYFLLECVWEFVPIQLKEYETGEKAWLVVSAPFPPKVLSEYHVMALCRL